MADFKGHFSKLKRFLSTCIISIFLTTPSVASNDGGISSNIQVIEKIQSFNPKLNQEDAYKILLDAVKWAGEFNISPTTILSIIAKESSFATNAFGKGSYGLMQVQLGYHRDKFKDALHLTGSKNPMDRSASIYVGARIYKDCERRYLRIERALKCYNGNFSAKSTYAKDVLRLKKQFDMLTISV